jgi:uncharacterized membrane protein
MPETVVGGGPADAVTAAAVAVVVEVSVVVVACACTPKAATKRTNSAEAATTMALRAVRRDINQATVFLFFFSGVVFGVFFCV